MKKQSITSDMALAADYAAFSVAAPVISMRADDAARLTGATIFFIEEQMREGALPFVWLGKRRIIYYSDLVSWARRQRAVNSP